MPRLCALLLAVCVVAFAACGDDSESATPAGNTGATAGGGCKPASLPPAKTDTFKAPKTVVRKGDKASVEFQTSCGAFTVELATDESPKAANAMAFLADQGFYDKTLFHRIVPGFVIQGGDPKQNGTGDAGFSVTDAPPDDAQYTKGVVAMAKGGNDPPGAVGSQFFVVTGADAGLPPDYAIAGRVIEGMDVVERIGKLGDAQTEKPTTTIVVDKATLQKGR